MKKIIFLIPIIFSSCKSKYCSNINYKLVNEFETNLKILKKAHTKKSFKVIEYRNALIYLSNTSQIMTRADYSNTLGYQNESDYRHDMEAWQNWLDENRCSVANR